MTGPLDDAITAAEGTAASAVAWSYRGQLHATVVAKASFAFASDADMPRLMPEPILPADVHYQKNPARSVRFISEIAPFLGLVDVVLTGHARSPAPAQALLVRLTVIDGGQTLLDKSLVARDPAGFQEMPLVYERAYGGLGVLDNPLGTGAAGESPGLIDPRDPARPACFAPHGRSWPSRKHLLGKTARKFLDAAIAQIPDDFAWAYYQTAPADQQIPSLGGGAWILVEGVSTARPLLRMRLPDVCGLAYVYGLGPEAQPLDLTLDTLHVDADDERCHVVLRGNVTLPDEGALGKVRILAGIASAGAPVTWPAVAPRAAPATTPPPGPAARPSTIALDGSEAPKAVLPFVQEAKHAAGTIALAPEEQAALAARPAVPFVSPAAGTAQTPPPRPPAPEVPAGTTFTVEPEEELAPPPAPAASAPPAPSPPEKKAEPWAPPPAAPPPAPPPSKPATGPVSVSTELSKGLYGRFGKR